VCPGISDNWGENLIALVCAGVMTLLQEELCNQLERALLTQQKFRTPLKLTTVKNLLLS